MSKLSPSQRTGATEPQFHENERAQPPASAEAKTGAESEVTLTVAEPVVQDRRQASSSVAQLLEANEHLVLATVTAQTMTAAAEQTTAQLREANEHLVVASVDAHRMIGVAEQATAQIFYQAKLEAQVQEAQKLETLGVLAGGVAHDFNNILTAIVSTANLGSLMVDPGSKVARYFEVIEKASMRAADLTRQLLAYAGEGYYIGAEVNLDIVIKEIRQVLAVSLPRRVTPRCELAERLPFVMGDSTQIFQVLMNLLTNASEAIPEGAEGKIAIRTGAERITGADLASSGLTLPMTPGRYVTVEITDTGTGMTPGVMARVFEPFFTTKFTGRGLGLAAALGIVRRHGGGMRVQSEPGQGSSFKIFLPAMLETRLIPTLESLPAWRGQGRLLVVEKEPAVNRMVRQMAEQVGFSVLEAGAGVEAIELFRRHHRELTLVLMDLNTPSKGGQEAFREMRNLDSSVPVVLSACHTVPDQDLWVEGLAGLLKKPYRIAEFQGLLKRASSLRPSASA